MSRTSARNTPWAIGFGVLKAAYVAQHKSCFAQQELGGFSGAHLFLDRAAGRD
jgi:hypothetical protein